MYKPEFQPVLYAMIEPKLRLIVEINQGRLDDDPCISVDFDPMLDEAHLTMTAPASPFRQNVSEVVTVFRSGKADHLANFWFRTDHRDDQFRIYILERDKPLAYDGRLTEKCAPWLTGQSWAILPATFEAALELPKWDQDAASLSVKIAHIAVFLGPLTAKRFAGAGFISEDCVTSDWTLFRERPVRPR